MIDALRIVFLRDLKVSLRRWTDVLTSLILFVLVSLVFPLTLGNDSTILLKIVGPVMLVSALLAKYFQAGCYKRFAGTINPEFLSFDMDYLH